MLVQPRERLGSHSDLLPCLKRKFITSSLSMQTIPKQTTHSHLRAPISLLLLSSMNLLFPCESQQPLRTINVHTEKRYEQSAQHPIYLLPLCCCMQGEYVVLYTWGDELCVQCSAADRQARLAMLLLLLDDYCCTTDSKQVLLTTLTAPC